ncbi:embryogenesis-like protein [Castanea sativa]|uniref:embryogenesis-like protein n=1 Tax=Castanea sativa TaxID=21020 RepID=UPI003F64C2F3
MYRPSSSHLSLSKLKSFFRLRHHFHRSLIPTSSSSSSFHSLVSNSPTSNSHLLPHPTRSIPQTHFTGTHLNHLLRKYCSESVDHNKEVDTINLKFAEAREEIEMAMESKETVYFNEEAECARAAVKEVLDRFEGLLAKLPESQRAALQRSMGLKIEQLKAELQQLDE